MRHTTKNIRYMLQKCTPDTPKKFQLISFIFLREIAFLGKTTKIRILKNWVVVEKF